MTLTKNRSTQIGLGIAALLVMGLATATTTAAQNAPSSPVKKEKKLAAGEKEAKKMILLMDKDQNGMVSKEEFMSFMEAEFDRLDKDKSGQLNVEELTQARVRTSSPHGR